MAEKLLTKSADILLDSGYEQVGSAMDRTGSNSGITHTVFVKNDHEFHVRAKEYVYKGLASFGVEQVEHAIEENAMLVLYVDNNESFTVFDPQFLEENGEEETGKSKRSDVRKWLEVPIEAGADLTGFIYGIEEPDALSGGNEELGAFV